MHPEQSETVLKLKERRLTCGASITMSVQDFDRLMEIIDAIPPPEGEEPITGDTP